MSARRSALLAAALYLGITLWALRVLSPAPGGTFAQLAYLETVPGGQGALAVGQADQAYVAWSIARNAYTFVAHPSHLMDGDQCYPVPHSITLGDHMLGDGLLGVVPYWLSGGNPVFTANAVTFASIWIAALAMWALVWGWTRSAGAAFIAGLLFAFHPVRLMDPGHPFVYGNQWTPLALLFAHRLFVRRSWWDAGGLTLFLGLQLLESFYQVIALAILGTVYGAYLLARHVRRLPRLAPQLAATGVAVGLVAIAVMGPYLHTRRAWGILEGRFNIFYLHVPSQFAPGGAAYPGSVGLALAAVALADRLRGPRRAGGYDPRLVYAVAGLLVLWTVLIGFTLPGAGVFVPSLLEIMAKVVPGLDAIRGAQYVRLGLYLVIAFLAGWGVLVLLEHRSLRVRRALTAAIAGAALVEVFWAPVARRSFSAPVALESYAVGPSEKLAALYRRIGAGPVLDFPFVFKPVVEMVMMSHYTLFGAFHRQPVAACYNSYKLPVQSDIEAIARHLPDVGAADALHALGFRTVIVHEEYLGPLERYAFYSHLGPLLDPPARLTAVGEAAGHRVYRLESPLTEAQSFEPLAASSAAADPSSVTAPDADLSFVFHNGSTATYRHPDPIEPTPLVVRWHTPSGVPALISEVTSLLPLALAPGEEAARSLHVAVPRAAGPYEVTVAPAARPDLVLARRRVDVVTGTAS